MHGGFGILGVIRIAGFCRVHAFQGHGRKQALPDHNPLRQNAPQLFVRFADRGNGHRAVQTGAVQRQAALRKRQPVQRLLPIRRRALRLLHRQNPLGRRIPHVFLHKQNAVSAQRFGKSRQGHLLPYVRLNPRRIRVRGGGQRARAEQAQAQAHALQAVWGRIRKHMEHARRHALLQAFLLAGNELFLELVQELFQRILGHGLQQIIGRLRADGGGHVGEVLIAGQHHDGTIRVQAFRLRHQLYAVHHGHADIGKQHVDMLGTKLLQRFLAVARRGRHAEIRVDMLNQPPGAPKDGRFVLSDQHPDHR